MTDIPSSEDNVLWELTVIKIQQLQRPDFMAAGEMDLGI